MQASVRELLDTLLSVTPAPGEHADPDEVLAAFDRVVVERQAPFAALEQALAAGRVLEPECAALLEQLRQRDAHWMAALVHARRLLSQRLSAARRLRHPGGG